MSKSKEFDRSPLLSLLPPRKNLNHIEELTPAFFARFEKVKSELAKESSPTKRKELAMLEQVNSYSALLAECHKQISNGR